MKSATTFLKPIAILFITGLLTGGDCSDRDNVGYHYFDIPGYDAKDYYQMLFSNNEEVQYNAICNLAATAKTELLEADSLKTSAGYPLALKTFEKIFSMMDAKNTWVSSAAIRYAGKFNYNRKVYLEKNLANSNPSLNVQLAIWDNWRNREADKAADSSLLVQKANFCLLHPSWLIQQAAYDYITPVTAPYFEDMFMKAYKATNEQYEKLKIIEVLNAHLCDKVFGFFTEAYAGTTDTMLLSLVLKSLPNALNRGQALQWFQLHKNETALLLKKYLEFSGKVDDIYPAVVLQALKQGWDPVEKLCYSENEPPYPLLYYYLFENKYHYESADSIKPPQSAIYASIEQQLLSDKKLRPGWLSYEQTHLRYPLPEQLVKEQKQLTEAYIVATKQLFVWYKLDTGATKNFMVQLDNITKDLYRSKHIHQ